MEQTDLRTHRTPARLAFADHVHGLVAGDGAPGGPKRSEMLTRVDPSLDRAVVLFQDVIQVWHRRVPTALLPGAFSLVPPHRRRGSPVAPRVGDARRGVASPSPPLGLGA